MLDDRLVYAKTPKGTAEINARSGDVSLAARRVLIMIDGRRTIADLAPFARPGEVVQVIQQLEAQGLVHQTNGIAAAPLAAPAPEPPPEESNEDRLFASFEAAKRRAVRELADRLGPDAEVIAVRIEHARTTDELRQRLAEAERLVAGFLGDAQAQEFARAVRRR
jgi:hypothetical protein